MKLNLKATIEELVDEDQAENERQAKVWKKSREFVQELANGVKSDVFNGKFEIVDDGKGGFALRGYHPREFIVEVSPHHDGTAVIKTFKPQGEKSTDNHRDAMRTIARALMDAGAVAFLQKT